MNKKSLLLLIFYVVPAVCCCAIPIAQVQDEYGRKVARGMATVAKYGADVLLLEKVS
jgi:hypothetical protein